MSDITKVPILRDDDGELLGFIAQQHASWSAQTIFGYVLARAETRAEAEEVVRSQGKLALKGMWRYQDSDYEWYPCIIKQAYENRVVVIRTNELGFQDKDSYKLVTIKNPTHSVLLRT